MRSPYYNRKEEAQGLHQHLPAWRSKKTGARNARTATFIGMPGDRINTRKNEIDRKSFTSFGSHLLGS
jgi:hypothetical protein